MYSDIILLSMCSREVIDLWNFQVVFQAAGQKVYTEEIEFDIEDRAPLSGDGNGIPFQLIGESCVPGINTSNVEAIFEEHVIKKELDPFNITNNEYSISDKVLSTS
jgi:hydrocephalus-inducing protein